MNDWSSGYVTDLDYTYGYYPELNPLRCRLALLQAGVHSPRFDTACELGFGQGVSANFHAAATGARWYGTDSTRPMPGSPMSWPAPRARTRACLTRPSPISAHAPTCRISISSACTASGAGFPMRTAASSWILRAAN